MDTLYLNSEKASEINVNQLNALLAWLNNGGHLIIAVEQISDVNATPWLRNLVPCELTDVRSLSSHAELQGWVRMGLPPVLEAADNASRSPVKRKISSSNPSGDLPADPEFENAAIQVVTGKPHGDVLVSSAGTPLLVGSRQGRGYVTVLLFSPEREPFRSWKNLPSFWAKLARVPSGLYAIETNNNGNLRGGWSIDGVFGAMIDSKQVRKLPVEWLLLLLIVYLVVIGPLDQYWLKRIKRPMLTWITFPCYVVLFSLLIYFIGYKLRAGETEWNELHVVDVLAHGGGAELRGRTCASIYSCLPTPPTGWKASSNSRLFAVSFKAVGAAAGRRTSAPKFSRTATISRRKFSCPFGPASFLSVTGGSPPYHRWMSLSFPMIPAGR